MNKTIKKELLLLEDLGMKFPMNSVYKKYRYGLYQCFCGNKFESQVNNINKGSVKSCGCLRNIKNNMNFLNRISNGFSSHRLYNTWNTMFHRCYNENRKDYKDYGLRGIEVCQEWLNIETFINDMYPSYVEGLTLDRKDNNKNYSKDNCIWSTKSSQVRNTRTIYSNNTSGYRGVHSYNDRFRVSIRIYGKTISLGTFKTSIEAAKAYDKYVIDNGLEHTTNFKKGD